MKSLKEELSELGYEVVKVKDNPVRMAIYKDGKKVHETIYANVDQGWELVEKGKTNEH